MLKRTCICDSCGKEDTREGEATTMAILSPGFHMVTVTLAQQYPIAKHIVLCDDCLKRHGLDRTEKEVTTTNVRDRLFDVVSEILLEIQREE